MHGETKKFVWFTLLQYLLSCCDFWMEPAISLRYCCIWVWHCLQESIEWKVDLTYDQAFRNSNRYWPVEEEVLEIAPQYQGPEMPSLCFSWTSPHVCKICHSGGYYILTYLLLKTGFKNISYQILSKIGSVTVIRERSPGVPFSFCQRGKMSFRSSSADSFLGLAGQHWVTWPSLAATESGKLSCLAVCVLGAEQGRKGCW